MEDSNLLQSKGYTMVTKLGAGHLSEVFHMKKGNDDFAVKTIKKLKDKPEVEKERQKKGIDRQTEILKVVKEHKNIVSLVESFEDENYVYLVFELVNGKNLEEMISKQESQINSPFEEENFLEIAIQILEAVDFIHKKGIMNRDLKPDNIIINENKEVKLVDFGLAAYCSDPNESHVMCGPINYVSPQVLEGANYDTKMDIYSLGVTFFQMMTFKLPFRTVFNEASKKYTRVINKEVEIPSMYNQEIKKLVLQMLDDKPENRPTAEQALNILKQIKSA